MSDDMTGSETSDDSNLPWIPATEFPLPQLPAPSADESMQLAVMREEFPPGDFGAYGDDFAAVLTYDLRRRWLSNRRSRHPREDELAAKTLALNLKFVSFLEYALSTLVGCFNLLPSALRWILARSYSKSNWYRYLLIGASVVALILSWLFLSGLFLVIAAIASSIVIIALISTRWLPELDWWENSVDGWIESIDKRQHRMDSVRRVVTEKINDVLARTDDHLETRDALVFEQTAIDDLEVANKTLVQLELEYGDNRRARLYLHRGKRIIRRYVRERALALWSWEKSRNEVDERARAHRWNLTMMATTIGGVFTVIKVVVLLVSLLLIPIVYGAIANGSKEKSQPQAEVQQVVGGEDANDEVAALKSEEPSREKPFDPWALAKSIGIISILLAVLNILVGYLINFVTRIGMRQLQFKKIKKNVDEDSLDVDCTWQWVSISLLQLKEDCIDEMAKVLDGIGLMKAERSLLESQRQHHRELLERLKLQYERKTGKKWLEPDSKGGSLGAVFDSGAPEDVAEAASNSFIDALLETF